MVVSALSTLKKFLKQWCSTKISALQFAIIVLAGFLFDQLTKGLIVQNISVNKSITVIPPVLNFYYVQNTGASFSILPHATLFLTIFSAVAVAVIILFYKKIPYQQRLFFALILAGTLGNFIDRVRLGYVIDFIDFHVWPVFNIADSLVTIGAVSLIYMIITDK